MTVGYNLPGHGAAGHDQDGPDSGAGADEPTPARSGPMPPRIEPRTGGLAPTSASAPPQAWPPPSPALTQPAVAAGTANRPAEPGYGQSLPVPGGFTQAAPVPGGFAQAAPVPGGFAQAAHPQLHAPGQPAYGHGPVPAAAPAYPMPRAGSQPLFAPQPVPTVSPGVAPGAAVAARQKSWPGMTAFLLALALTVVAGLQAYQISSLSDRLGDANRRLSDAQSGAGSRFDSLEGRTDELEKQAGKVFNPEAISSAVLPSVFRVRAGQFTGTAFAVGKPAAGGGTNLFTNFHVVESVWEAGGRKVSLERTDQRFPATIVKVDKANDVAQLKTDAKFDGLAAASAPVKSGQQIVVVGAPLGLEDTVTTGVVSAVRKNEDGPGNVIQFDAPINPGNSGGPVINGTKQVVGIATAKARNAEGIGLAVPIKTACDQFKIC